MTIRGAETRPVPESQPVSVARRPVVILLLASAMVRQVHNFPGDDAGDVDESHLNLGPIANLPRLAVVAALVPVTG